MLKKSMSPRARYFRGSLAPTAASTGAPDDDAEGVGRDEVAGLGRGDVQALFDLFEQAHHGEFCGADAEAAHRQGKDGKGKVAGAGLGRRRSLCGGSHSSFRVVSGTCREEAAK